jgi:hypothetical protein
MGAAASLGLIALGAILVVHHRIPEGSVAYVVAGGAALIALSIAGLALSIRFWGVFGGPASPPE